MVGKSNLGIHQESDISFWPFCTCQALLMEWCKQIYWILVPSTKYVQPGIIDAVDPMMRDEFDMLGSRHLHTTCVRGHRPCLARGPDHGGVSE